MSTPTIGPDAHMITSIRNAVQDCSDRGLTMSAKWASELLLSIPACKRTPVPVPDYSISTPAHPNPPLPEAGPSQSHPHAPPIQTQTQSPESLALELQDSDVLTTAKTCLQSREFLRAVHLLRDCKSAKARFLSVYSQFMASEKKALRDWHKLDNNRHQPPVPVNASMMDLFEMVKDATDPWLLFLKSLFLSRIHRREEAIEHALLSLAGYPWNWSAWTLLCSLIGDGEELTSLLPLLPLPPTHPLSQMFQIKTLNELHNPSDHELALCDGLLTEEWFPGSLWVMTLRARVLYHLHDFPRAELQFEKILSLDPYRIDDIDIFSNILYVREKRLKLSRLAHEFLGLDKDRPEVCCLVGNHYSMRAEHEKAIKYFRRATQLDRTYLSAWTLMGHEYVEMKNSHAAIEAYRRAVDVNRKDYRAWYGLGQAYVLLSMYQYALHYYQHATALRPYDVRLWQAQGTCFEDLGRLREAIECLKRALIVADPRDTSINVRLAKLHDDLGEYVEAAAYHRRVVEVCMAEKRPVQDYAKSSIYVAQHNMKIPNGDLELAREYLQRVASSNAEQVSTAAQLLSELKLAMDIMKAKAEVDAKSAAAAATAAAGSATSAK